jgi:hypothetical protein
MEGIDAAPWQLADVVRITREALSHAGQLGFLVAATFGTFTIISGPVTSEPKSREVPSDQTGRS